MTELDLLVASMNKHGLDPVGVQRHGQLIVDALNADYPDLHAWVHPQTDAVVWPPLGPIDVTIDSGLGGWSFQPNAAEWAPGQLEQWNRDNPSRYVAPPAGPADPVLPPPNPPDVLLLVQVILNRLAVMEQTAIDRHAAILAAIRAIQSGSPAPGSVHIPGFGNLAITFTPER